jgi:hypothetical protein
LAYSTCRRSGTDRDEEDEMDKLKWVQNCDLQVGDVYKDGAMVTVVADDDCGTWVEDDAGNSGYVNRTNKVEVFR